MLTTLCVHTLFSITIAESTVRVESPQRTVDSLCCVHSIWEREDVHDDLRDYEEREHSFELYTLSLYTQNIEEIGCLEILYHTDNFNLCNIFLAHVY